MKNELHPSIPPTPIIDKNESAPTTVALVLQTSSLPTEQESPAHYSTKAYSIHDLPPHQVQHIGLTETAAEKERKKKGRQPHTAVQYNTPCPKKEAGGQAHRRRGTARPAGEEKSPAAPLSGCHSHATSYAPPLRCFPRQGLFLGLAARAEPTRTEADGRLVVDGKTIKLDRKAGARRTESDAPRRAVRVRGRRPAALSDMRGVKRGARVSGTAVG